MSTFNHFAKMQKENSKEVPLRLVLQGPVENEEVLPTCIVKQENDSTDNTGQLASPTFELPLKYHMIHGEDGTNVPLMKRVKLENDDSSFLENEVSLSCSSKTSLFNIVSEVAQWLENKTTTPSFDSNKDSGLDIANNRNPLVQNDSKSLESTGGQLEDLSHSIKVNEGTTGHEDFESPLTTINSYNDADKSGLPSGELGQAVTTTPIPRTIKSLNSGVHEGFAFDHVLLPKVVSVRSVLSTSSSPAAELIPNLQQTSSPIPHGKAFPDQRTAEVICCDEEEAADAHQLSADASVTSNDSLPENSNTKVQSPKHNDLLLTFTQEDGKKDMFLVIKDEVFAVQRFYYRGESYLIHTDSKGKKTVLAKAQREKDAGSQSKSGVLASVGETVLIQRGKTRYISSSAMRQSRNMPCQENSTQKSREVRWTIHPALRRSSVQTSQTNARETVYIPTKANESHPVSSSTQVSNKPPLIHINRKSAESSEYVCGPQGEPEKSPAGQLRLPAQASEERQHSLINGLLQNLNADNRSRAHFPSRAVNAPSDRWFNQPSNVNRDIVTRIDLSRDEEIVNGPNQRCNSGTQSTLGHGRKGYLTTETIDRGLLALDKRTRTPSVGNERKVDSRCESLKRITDNFASNEKPVQQTLTNPLGFADSSSREIEATRYSYDAVNKRLNKSTLNGRYQQMRNVTQRLGSAVSLSQENAESHTIRNKNTDRSDQRTHPNQSNFYNGCLPLLQPRSTVPDRSFDSLQGNFRSRAYGVAKGKSKILEILESWKRRRQSNVSNKDCQVLRQLLNRTHQSVSSVQNNSQVNKSQSATTAGKNTQGICKASSTKSVTPIITQVSYGLSANSKAGGFPLPKKSATALVINQGRPIYVDATNSIIDEGWRLGNVGQRFLNVGNTVSGLNSNISGNVTISQPVSLGSSVSQNEVRQMNSGLTLGQQLSNSTTSSTTSSLTTDQRLDTSLAQFSASKLDEHRIVNNILKPVNTSILGTERTVISGGKQSYICEGTSNAAKLRAITKGRVIDEPCEFVKPGVVAKAGEAAKPHEVIEIADSPPSSDSTNSNCNVTTDCEIKETECTIVGEPSSSIAQLQSCVEQLPPLAGRANKAANELQTCNPSIAPHSNNQKKAGKGAPRLKEEEAAKIRNEALRDELVKKINNTRERFEKEEIEWKKSRLSRLKMVLMRKLAKLSGSDIIVDDE